MLARHHVDLKRAVTTEEELEAPKKVDPSEQELPPQMAFPTQAEQVQQARRERRLAAFAQVHELYAQGWSLASIARMLGMNKKTVRKFAEAEQFPESRSRSDHGRKLAPYLPYLQAQWVAGEYNIAHLYQAIRTQGYRGSETSVRTYLTSLRAEIGPQRRPRRYYPPVSREKQRRQQTAVSSRRATWLVLRRQEDLSAEDQHTLTMVLQAHAQVKSACVLAQAFAQMIRSRSAPALDPWLEEATNRGVPELRSFAAGIQRDHAAVLAALTYAWSHDYVA
ncbi:MAG: transposase [Ktedonobacteraceae bacterium]